MKTDAIKKFLITDVRQLIMDLYDYEDQVLFHNVNVMKSSGFVKWHVTHRNIFPKIISIANKMNKVGARTTTKTIAVNISYKEFDSTVSGPAINYQPIYEKIIDKMVELGCFNEFDDVEYDNRYGKNLKVSEIGFALKELVYTF